MSMQNPTQTLPPEGSTHPALPAATGLERKTPNPASPAHQTDQGIAGAHTFRKNRKKKRDPRRRFSFAPPARLFAALQVHAARANLTVTEFIVDALQRLVEKRRSPQLPSLAYSIALEMSRMLQCVAALQQRIDAVWAELGDMSPTGSLTDLAARATADGVIADALEELAATRLQLALHLTCLPRPRSARTKATTNSSIAHNEKTETGSLPNSTNQPT